MKEMTVEIFFTQPNIVANVTVPLRLRNSLADVTSEPFMDSYTLKMDNDGGAVFDGDKLIASIGRFTDLVVDVDYRGHGIATELVYQMIVHNPEHLPTRKAVRSAWGAKAYQAAWTRYNTASN